MRTDTPADSLGPHGEVFGAGYCLIALQPLRHGKQTVKFPSDNLSTINHQLSTNYRLLTDRLTDGNLTKGPCSLGPYPFTDKFDWLPSPRCSVSVSYYWSRPVACSSCTPW